MPIIVVSGPSGFGKTTLCERTVAAARTRGLLVRGVLSPARLAGDVKVGIDVLDLSNGEQRSLAEAGSSSGRRTTKRWRFDATALEWGMRVLQRAVPCDLLVIDELGPLELLRGAGWSGALQILRAGGYRWALVVVRPDLVQRFLELVPTTRPVIVMASCDEQDRLLAEISGLWEDNDAHR